jgi:transcriptional regulator with XRE-family HTH domain
MKVFFGWSGETSHSVALALSDWLPKVIQAVRPFVSSEDIAKGARWSLAIAKELQDSSFGIICVTKENSESAWINFEAGALSKEIETALVTPFLFNLRAAEIEGPLKQFQLVVNEKSDILKLVRSINSGLGENRLEDASLQATFEMWWTMLNDRLKGIQLGAGKTPIRQSRSTTEMVEELLELTRAQQREMTTFLRMSSALQQPSFFGQVGRVEQGVTISAGQRLRALREALGLTLRDVEQASSLIARRFTNEEFAISPSRMSDVESKGVVPSVFRLYSLASIYRRDFAELLCFYGLDFSGVSTPTGLGSLPTPDK